MMHEKKEVSMELLADIGQAFQPLTTTLSTLVSLKNKAAERGASEFAVELNDAIIEMQAKVIEAQNVALQVQTQSLRFVARISELEAEVSNPTWKDRYYLYRVDPRGDAVYRLRAEHEPEEVMHEICTACCDIRRAKAILIHWTGGTIGVLIMPSRVRDRPRV